MTMDCWPSEPAPRRPLIDREAASFGRGVATGIMLSLPFWLIVAWVVL